MILLIVYILLTCYFIYKNDLFGILRDEILNKKFFLTAFILKLFGILAVYVVYVKLYGGISYSDTDHYFQDSKLLNSVAYWDLGEFIKLMVGLQDESENSELFSKFIQYTTVWDSNAEEFLYNDNRLMLRFNALIHFISFNNYFVHAFFCCLLSLIGITWIYKTFKELFNGKEVWLFMVWVVFPGLWFWSAALFKEGPALFVIGLLLISIKKIIGEQNYSIKNIVALCIGLVLSFTFKQYVMLPILIISILFFVFAYRFASLRNVVFFFTVSLISVFLIGNLVLKKAVGKSIVESLAQRQKTFVDLSHGGIFLLDSTRFIRLPYDTLSIMVTRIVNDKKFVTIKAGVSYSYCELSHQQDTLVNLNNADTTSEYLLYYEVNKANSAIDTKLLDGTLISFIKAIPSAFIITISKPLFFDARNIMDVLTSVENSIIILAFISILIALIRGRINWAWVFYFLAILFTSLIIIGVTSPNIGAIQRYRALTIPFLFMCALLSVNITDPKLIAKMFKKEPNN